MKILTSTILAGAVAFGMAASAQAATTPSPGVSWTPNENDTFTVIFDFGSPAIDAQTGLFGIAFDFDLTIESVETTSPSLAYFIEDAAGTRLIDISTPNVSESTCDGGAQCNIVYANEFGGKPLFSNLASGDYNFGIFGGSISGSSGSITFGVSKVSPVPLPAGGLLLLTGLGALAFKRRRKTA